jgi:hypothetical protein
MHEIALQIAREINKHINIPFLSEEQELLLITAIVEAILTTFEKKV